MSEAAAGSAPSEPIPVSVCAPITRAYPAPADLPTQQGPKGLRFDFNDGCRILLPKGEHPWRIRLSDLDTGNILYQTELEAGRVNSAKRYFVRFRIEVSARDETVLSHDYSVSDREVLVQFPVGTIGDTIGWFPYSVKFKERHRCRLTCGMAQKLIPLFRDAYPDISFVTHEEIKPETFYATYSMGDPHGAEDETGERPLQERARWLKHAEFFIGLSSGLSWVAWAAGTPV